MYLEISNPMDYHVALYIRLSKEDESEGPSESVTNQKSLLNEFVQQHRLSVYDTYIDDGWSGTSFNRPAFQRMIGERLYYDGALYGAVFSRKKSPLYLPPGWH